MPRIPCSVLESDSSVQAVAVIVVDKGGVDFTLDLNRCSLNSIGNTTYNSSLIGCIGHIIFKGIKSANYIGYSKGFK